MVERTIDTEGAKELVKAIVRQARVDFMNTRPGSVLHEDAESFFRSQYFEDLTELDGRVILHGLRKQHERKYKKRKGRLYQ